MIIIWKAIEIFVNFFQMYIIYKTFDLFYDRRFSYKHMLSNAMIVMTVLVTAVNYYISIKDNIFIYLMLYVFIYISTIIIFNGKITTKAILIFGILFILFVCELAASALMMVLVDTSISKVYDYGFYRLAIMTISQTIFFYIYTFVRNKTFNKRIILVNKKYYILIGLILFVNIIAITVVVWMYGNLQLNDNFYIFLITVSISALSMLELILFINILKNSISESEKDKLLFQYETGSKYYTQINDILEEMRIIKHNLKNSLIIIDTYNKTNQKEKLQKYIDDLIDETNVFVVPQIDKENIVTSYLNYKVEQAKSNNIKVFIENQLTNEIILDKTDICQVIGNIMDNAIEANEKNIDKYIKILLYNNDNYIIIKSENPTNERLIKKDNVFLTTKKDAKNHGLGLKSIQKIAEKYDGSLEAEAIDNLFIIKVVFLNEKLVNSFT
nr:GHKL domain-containing protein [Sedimentibacter sp.]